MGAIGPGMFSWWGPANKLAKRAGPLTLRYAFPWGPHTYSPGGHRPSDAELMGAFELASLPHGPHGHRNTNSYISMGATYLYPWRP